ncbi:MAG: hypothetical protein HYU39_06735 [Thaumarchaeota archaeon]|nr:hypothetical protein [Nitrososphaerota archaeon]
MRTVSRLLVELREELAGTIIILLFASSFPYLATAQATVSLTVTSKLSDNSLFTGMWTELRDSNGTLVGTGWTIITYSVISGQTYHIVAADYNQYIFDHWDDGSTNRFHTFSITEATSLTAYYRLAFVRLTVISKFTSENSLTGVNTELRDSSNNLVSSGPTPIEYTVTAGRTYALTAFDTENNVFDHWDTGATGSSITITLSSDTTHTAYYRSSDVSISYALEKTYSGFVAADPLTSSLTREQLSQSSYWTFGGSAFSQSPNAPNDYFEDSNGLHIGVQSIGGKWAGLYAVTRDTTAFLFHATITTPYSNTDDGWYNVGLYVQDSINRLTYVSCYATVGPSGSIHWAVGQAKGNSTTATWWQNLWSDTSPNQPSTRECTLITNGRNYMTVYMDGQLVFSSKALKLDMRSPFVIFLETQTSSTSNLLYGVFRDYYVSLDESIKVTRSPLSGSARIVDPNTGKVLATGVLVKDKTTSINIAQAHFPLTARIQVYDNSNNLVASEIFSTWGGDIFSLSKL